MSASELRGVMGGVGRPAPECRWYRRVWSRSTTGWLRPAICSVDIACPGRRRVIPHALASRFPRFPFRRTADRSWADRARGSCTTPRHTTAPRRVPQPALFAWAGHTVRAQLAWDPRPPPTQR